MTLPSQASPLPICASSGSNATANPPSGSVATVSTVHAAADSAQPRRMAEAHPLAAIGTGFPPLPAMSHDLDQLIHCIAVKQRSRCTVGILLAPASRLLLVPVSEKDLQRLRS